MVPGVFWVPRAAPRPGGVLIQGDGGLLGAVGVSGDTSDNDEICAVASIEAAGLKAAAGYHFPVHEGLRFSPKALRPSLASSVIASNAIWLSV